MAVESAYQSAPKFITGFVANDPDRPRDTVDSDGGVMTKRVVGSLIVGAAAAMLTYAALTPGHQPAIAACAGAMLSVGVRVAAE
jgi:hypothetical protein